MLQLHLKREEKGGSKMKMTSEEIQNWEKEYLTMDPQLSKRQRAILEGDDIKSHEGMLFGGMYADWKKRKGYD